MERIMTGENLRSFAYVNDRLCTGRVKGIVLSFFGLGGMEMYDDDHAPREARLMAEKNILYVVPYTNPWAWMNRQAVGYTDEIIDVLMGQYALPEDLPIVSSGGSMGGLGAIVYTRYAKRTPVACVANCPVCDLVFHFWERPDLPRTIYSALWNEKGSLDEALKTISPLHLADTMPRIPYRIFHCGRDLAVDLESHSRRFAAAMLERGHDIRLVVVPDRGHCDLPQDVWEKYLGECADAVEKA